MGDADMIAVNVRADGSEKDGGKPFSTQWSWIMLVKKIDGLWVNSGNASSQLPRPTVED